MINFFWGLCSLACRVLVPLLEIQPGAMALSPNHWAIWELPADIKFKLTSFPFFQKYFKQMLLYIAWLTVGKKA